MHSNENRSDCINNSTIVLDMGVVMLIVLPPMPLRLGYYIMNHRIVLCISWCVVAITGYLSLLKKK